MKPERIGMEIQCLELWQVEERCRGGADTFHSSLLFNGPLAAQRFMLDVLEMATRLDLDLDAELVGRMLVLHLPGADQPLAEKHLQFARAVESLAAAPAIGLRREPAG